MKYVLLLLLCSATRLFAQTGNDSVFREARLNSFSLAETNAVKTTHLTAAATGSRKPKLFIFLIPDCPICRSSSPELNRLFALYGKTTDVYGIIPGKTYSNGAIDSFARHFNIRFRLLADKSLGLSHYLQATVTPQVILLNERNELEYKGAIDDSFLSLGKPNTHASRHYLADALDALRKARPAPEKRTRAVGCILNDY